jgi:hypothetical protein
MADPATRGKGAEGALLTALAGSGEKRTAQVSWFYNTTLLLLMLLLVAIVELPTAVIATPL